MGPRFKARMRSNNSDKNPSSWCEKALQDGNMEICPRADLTVLTSSQKEHRDDIILVQLDRFSLLPLGGEMHHVTLNQTRDCMWQWHHKHVTTQAPSNSESKKLAKYYCMLNNSSILLRWRSFIEHSQIGTPRLLCIQLTTRPKLWWPISNLVLSIF